MKLGMYVMDESAICGPAAKLIMDYGMFFLEWWEKDVEAMVRKDFNHPSVIMYSVGNEIPEIGTDHGAKLCHEICEKIKELDPIRIPWPPLMVYLHQEIRFRRYWMI